MDTVFHVSEDSSIERFEPRMPPTQSVAVNTPVVWAVAQTHLANYLLPRECPRVAFRAASGSSEHDLQRFLGRVSTAQVVAIESRWFEYASSCALWLYKFSSEPFVCVDPIAGYFVSAKAVVPVSKRRIERPLSELVASGTELRVIPSLLELAAEVTSSSLAFSCIRMRNAGVGPNAA